jgi:hypothetical protein
MVMFAIAFLLRDALSDCAMQTTRVTDPTGQTTCVSNSVFRNLQFPVLFSTDEGGGAISLGSNVQELLTILDSSFINCRAISLSSWASTARGGACLLGAAATVQRCCGVECYANLGCFLYFKAGG